MFEPTILNPNPSRRARYIDIMEAALQAVDPFRAVQSRADTHRCDTPRRRPIV